MILGHLCVIHTTLTNPPKDKLVICVCAAVPLFIWINTDARKHGIAQMPLVAADHPQALTHNCHLDCSRVTTFRAPELAAAQDRGLISADLAERIAEFITAQKPKTLTPGQTQTVLTNLALI